MSRFYRRGIDTQSPNRRRSRVDADAPQDSDAKHPYLAFAIVGGLLLFVIASAPGTRHYVKHGRLPP